MTGRDVMFFKSLLKDVVFNPVFSREDYLRFAVVTDSIYSAAVLL